MSDIKDPVKPEDVQPGTPVTDPKSVDGKTVNPPENDPTKELIRQRDRNFEDKRKAEDKLTELEMRLNQSDAEKQKAEFLDSISKDSNLTPRERKLLDMADSEDAGKEILAEILDYRKESQQAALLEINSRANAPRYTPESAEEKLNSLKDSGDLEAAIEVQLNTRR
jgi:hypothetical protein